MVSSGDVLSASDADGDYFKTGPIIRISPHEIHIDDPDFFDKLNSFQGKWNKDPYTAHQFANPGSSVGTIEHDLHRKRRMAVLPFFSKTKIYALEPVIQSTIDRLCNRIEDYVKSGQPLNLRNAYKCFAADVVAEYCFAESGGLIDKPDFSLGHWKEHQQGLKAALRARYLPAWYLPVVRGAPEWIRATVDPAAKHFEVWHRVSLAFPDTKSSLTDQSGCGWASSPHGRQEERRLLRKGRPSNYLSRAHQQRDPPAGREANSSCDPRGWCHGWRRWREHISGTHSSDLLLNCQPGQNEKNSGGITHNHDRLRLPNT